MKLTRSVNFGFAIVFILLIGAGAVTYHERGRRTEERASAHLKTMLMLRESVLRGYFESLRSEIILWSSQSSVATVLLEVTEDYERQGAAGLGLVGRESVSSLKKISDEDGSDSVDERVRRFALHHQYHDVFFISKTGDVLYTVAKESDYGTNLVTGPYADSGLGRLFDRLKASTDPDQIVFEDFSAYAPSADEPAAFIGSPIHANDEGIGYYAVQIPAEPINRIMQFSAGMGESGETYLVGPDRLMRSDSRFFEESSILETTVDGATIAMALDGQIGLSIVDDYRGIRVYSAYRPFDFEGMRWAVLAEQDVAEIEAPIAETLEWILIGYAGLFLTGLLLRFVLMHAVLPAALGAFLGMSMLEPGGDEP
jgi:methyl-accepting chemotaxis protein